LQNTAQLPPDTRIALMAAYDRDQTSYLIQDFTTNRSELISAMQNFVPPNLGATPILMGAVEATLALFNLESRASAFDDAVINAVIVISDGRQTTPPIAVSDFSDLALEGRVRFFPVSWGIEPNHALMAELAYETDGLFYPAGGLCNQDEEEDLIVPVSLAQLTRRLQDVVNDLASHYVVTYTTLNQTDSVVVRLQAQLLTEDEVLIGTSREYDINPLLSTLP